MKIDRDNFRHLTGFGRDMANYVGWVFDRLDHNSLGPGSLVIRDNQNTGEVDYQYISTDEIARRFLPSDFVNDDTVHSQKILIIYVDRNGFREGISLPWMMLHPLCRSYYHVYRHTFVADQHGDLIANALYTGVTKRGWRTRWQEHLRSATSGSHYRFHKAIRQWHNVARIVTHDIVGWAPSEQKAMDLEEHLVQRDSLYPLGLNMIPGGKSGLAYLRKIGALGENERVSVDDRQAVINRFFERASRKGLPNPLAAANWLSSDYAEKVICAGPDRLKPQQIRDARFFASLGDETDDITRKIGARNSAQVQRLLDGTTYGRIL